MICRIRKFRIHQAFYCQVRRSLHILGTAERAWCPRGGISTGVYTADAKLFPDRHSRSLRRRTVYGESCVKTSWGKLGRGAELRRASVGGEVITLEAYGSDGAVWRRWRCKTRFDRCQGRSWFSSGETRITQVAPVVSPVMKAMLTRWWQRIIAVQMYAFCHLLYGTSLHGWRCCTLLCEQLAQPS